MIIKNVYIYNFILFDTVDVELGEGVFFITGENRDEPSSESNGAGKSTFCNAIIWAFFDHLLKKSFKKDDVVGSIDEYCQVVVEFEDNDGRTIVIDRVRSHPSRGNSVTIEIDGEDKTKHLDKDSNEYIEQLLIDSKTVYHCAYSDASKEPLPALTSSQLNKVVSEIIDSSRFDDYIKDVKKSGREYQSDISICSTNIVNRMEQIESLEKDVESFKVEIASFDANRNDKIESIQSDVVDLNDQLDELKEILKGKKAVEEEIEQLQESVKQVDGLNAELKKDSKILKGLEKDLVSKQKKVSKLEGLIIEQDSAHDNLFRNDSGECGYCGNFLKDSKKIADIAEQIESRRNELKSELIMVEVVRDDLIREIKYREEKIEGLEQELKDCREVVDKYNQLVREADNFKSIETECGYIKNNIKTSLKEIEKLELATPDFLNGQLEKTKERLAASVKSLKGLSEELENAESAVKACGILEDAIKQTKVGLFNGFIIKLQDGINRNLEQLTNGDYHCRLVEHKGELNLNFINGVKKEYLSYHAFSAGERQRISKACSMALNDLLDVGFMFDDEGLSGLDGQGAKDVLEFIVSQGSGKSIFFVSHLTSVKDYLANARNIHIIKSEGLSTAEVI